MSNEPNTPKPKIFTVLKIVAPIAAIVGITLIILSTAVFPEMRGGIAFGPRPALLVPGLFTTFFSIPMFAIGFYPEIHKTSIKTEKYLQETNKKDLTAIADNSADISSHAITKTTRAVKEGFRDKTIFCKHCGSTIDADSKFCKKCGKEQ